MFVGKQASNPSLVLEANLPICVACGTQYGEHLHESEIPANCPICEDPRQYVPPAGQQWTTLARMQSGYENKWKPIPNTNERLYSLWTEPKFAIGQRAILVRSAEHGNVLWDCLAHLDQHTIEWIDSLGGLKAIVISHPHYYTTHLSWARAFKCPIYLASEDVQWAQRADEENARNPLTTPVQEIVPGVTAVKVGGHFPGSLVLHVSSASPQGAALLVADTFVTTPSALTPRKHRRPGTTTYAFMWAVPNMIPLPPKVLMEMWEKVKGWEFGSSHGAFVGQEVWDEDQGEGVEVEGRVKARVLESMRIQAKGEGWGEESAEIMREKI